MNRYVPGRRFRLRKIRGGVLPPKLHVDHSTPEENQESVRRFLESERVGPRKDAKR